MTQAKRMEHAIGDIFDADRLTRGEPVLERRSTEIDTLVRRVVREFPFAEERDLDVVGRDRDGHGRPRARRTPARRSAHVGRRAHRDRRPHRARARTRARRRADLRRGRDPPNGDGSAGAAAAFLAKLHGGWTKAERLPDGTGVVRAFLPNGRTAGATDEAESETAAALG